MIIVITGKNGSGKTLLAVELLRDFNKTLEREGQPPRKIYTNIRDCKYGEQWENNDWRETQDGTIFVYDEAQKLFPQRSASKAVPEILKDLDTHRHNGFDLIFITQYPTHIDHHIRQLCNKHYHVIRRSGMAQNILYTHDEIFDPTDKKSMSGVHKSLKRFDKSLFKDYKSSFEHNYKRDIPKSTKIKLGLFALAIIFAVYKAYTFYDKRVNLNQESATKLTAKKPKKDYSKSTKKEKEESNYQEEIENLVQKFSINGMFKGVKQPKILKPKQAYYTTQKVRMSKIKNDLEISSCITYETTCRCYSHGKQIPFPTQSTCHQLAEYGNYYVKNDKKTTPQQSKISQWDRHLKVTGS